MNTGPAITFASLAHQPIWVAWKQEPRRGKRTTLPYDPVTGRLATSNDSANERLPPLPQIAGAASLKKFF